MTGQPFSKEVILKELGELLPETFALFGICFLLFLVALITRFIVNRGWRKTLHLHLPDVTREELRTRDEKIHDLEKEVAALQKKNKAMAVMLRGIRGCLSLGKMESE